MRHLKEAKDTLAFPLLHEITRPWTWNRWLEREGVALEHSLPDARFDQFNMVVEAAKACLGIALVPRFLFEDEIAAKQLFIPFKRSVLGEHKYYFAYPHRNSGNAVMLDFKEWLLETAHGEHLPGNVGQARPWPATPPGLPPELSTPVAAICRTARRAWSLPSRESR